MRFTNPDSTWVGWTDENGTHGVHASTLTPQQLSTVDPYIPSPQPQSEIDISAAKNYAKLQALKYMSPTQVMDWVDSNVTTLAQARDAIKTLAIAVSILARRM